MWSERVASHESTFQLEILEAMLWVYSVWSTMMFPSSPMKAGVLPTFTISRPDWRAKSSSFLPWVFSSGDPAARVWALLSPLMKHGMLLAVHQSRSFMMFAGTSGFLMSQYQLTRMILGWVLSPVTHSPTAVSRSQNSSTRSLSFTEVYHLLLRHTGCVRLIIN